MTLEQLNYFIHLATTGSFSQSAKALGLSQSALSRQIGQLEAVLEASLFYRHQRPMQLTAQGQFFLTHIQNNLQVINEAIILTQQYAQVQQSGELTIGFVASILYGLLPEIVKKLKQQVAHLDIKLVEVGSNHQVAALKLGKIDVAFGRFLYHDPFIRQIFLRHERFVVAVPKSHPLADKDDEMGISFMALNNEPLILYHRTPLNTPEGISDQLIYWFTKHNVQPKYTIKASDIQIALGLVSAGEGITLVPDSLKIVRTEQIHYRRLLYEDVTSSIYLNVLAHKVHPHTQALLKATYEVYEEKGITYTPLLFEEDH